MPVAYPQHVVDIHTHLFNARHIPLKGVLQSKGVPGWLAGPARTLLNLLTGKADVFVRPDEHFIPLVADADELDALATALATVAATEMAERTVTKGLIVRAEGPFDAVDETLVALRSDELYSVLEELEGLSVAEEVDNVQAYQRQEVHAFVAALADLGAETDLDVFDSIGGLFLKRFLKALRWLLGKLLGTILGDAYGTAMDYVKFFLLMLCKEKTLRDALLASYPPEQNVNLVLHLMMDMEKAYSGEKPYYAFYKKQIKRMEDVVDGAVGRVVGFVAFDPRRSDPDGLTIVKYALSRGCCGVKIYPPMGFLPWPDDPRQRDRLERLYTFCQSERVPILTHCTAVGFEAYKGSGVLSDPDNWQPVLDRFADLILSYGHAGGGGADNYLTADSDEKVPFPGWYANTAGWNHPRNFARKVLDHCRRYPHVYCDFSYFNGVVDDQAKKAAFKENLIEALSGAGHQYPFADKMMYGSDWHMPLMTRRTATFLEELIELFDDPALSPHKDKFFYMNALRLLDLGGCVRWHSTTQPSALSDATLESFRELDERKRPLPVT